MLSEGGKRIRLILEEPGGIERTSLPVTQGTPFPEGELRRGDPVRIVTEAGDALPSQSICLAKTTALKPAGGPPERRSIGVIEGYE